ncbi:RNA binding protein [Arabidopsis thaliana]|jgi:RNA-binding protein Musashi|uniref:RNA-binding protein 1 n=1 Tax=Arabidopsis thaliana TaxID=3702 RepID=RBP1_ARATH|nr:RNA-binding protein 1 [Arabidopsis thaliana]NP_176143.1 RNA-binding protein 1 [Arabidopsis thaliana]Q9C652.1 RecName: Full=RNA-binding protein 1; Short=AtRBP1 [Arabidopsis thaliana]AAG50640.1 RNA binding protein [Arabidopsis thaliana]AAK96727.1 RNA binding protein [Arabidopsis thaliana]AAL47356.1 RNA binding protein [Arabidopsis thaliana]AEE33552.1 RNA-binding protein 1 [Arabidopsis thaliana]ANM57927.1 RNA-binding protein 1 [Arabidopsis thaliana]|eukprot:NP_001320402.1 RNA-binding protein 1 [Arabidopsis thaliana]
MDYDRYKLFVGGIAKETSEEALKQYFSRYGAVLEAVVAKEKVTGKPRGFGFVRFANDCDVVKALRDTHFILGKPVDVRKAIRKHELYQQPFSMQFLERKVQQMNGGLREMSSNGVTSRTKKIFVGGLSSNTTEEEFKSYFERFGRTTDVVVMHDGVTNRPRGFGFVTYDSEDSVEVVMQSNFHELSDKRVEVKRAIPKEGIQSNNGNAVNIPPSYSSFQATPYVPEQNGYGMVLQFPPPVFGYHHNVQAVQYPYGYQFTAQVANVSWNNPIMQPTGFYCAPPHPTPPPTNNLGYIQYMNGFDLSGTNISGYNPLAWPVTGDAAGALIHQFVDLKLDVHSQAHQRMNGGNMGIPLQNGTYI